VALSLRIFSSDNSLRPGLACEITPEGVIAARQAGVDQAVMAFAPLASGVLQPGLAAANIADQAAVVAALRQALDEVALREKQLTLVVPDAAVRVLILDFDSLPSKAHEAMPIVRFRLRKLAPFEVDDAAVSYQIMRQDQGQLRVLVTVMPAEIRAEYEGAVRAAAYEPGVILPSMLASLAALRSSDAALVVNRNGLSLTTAITNGDELLLHRTLELPASVEAQRAEVAQAVSVASAYFEDTMHAAPNVLYYSGPGGAEAFVATLGAETEDGLRMVRDLVPASTTGAVSAMPKGLTAGVMGALAS
jgi:type IV pilus assembly protein PilM